MLQRRLSYANVVSTLALFVALGGGAYAVATIGSSDVKNNSLRGVDVKRNSLTGADIKEHTLKASGFIRSKSAEDASCDPTSATPIKCVTANVDLQRRSRVLVIAAGEQYSVGGAASASCQLQADGVENPTNNDVLPGEAVSVNTSSGETNGFSITGVSEEPLPAGPHEFALACAQVTADVRIGTTTISILAISGR